MNESAIIALVVVGFLMIAAEVFVPGLILGTLGGICLITAVVMCYAAFGPLIGTGAFVGLGALTLAGFFAWMNIFPRTFIGKKITLGKTLEPETSMSLPALEGADGVALTPLRPAGTALINGRRIDVVAESIFINAGDPVTVIFQEGLRVVVRGKV